MIVTIGGVPVDVDGLEVKASVTQIARQFTITDISSTQRFPRNAPVMILSDDFQLIISGIIEHINATAGESQSEFKYSGRNYALYLVDGYADKTYQFTEGQDIIGVFNKILGRFGISAIGEPVKLPKKSMKKILIGDKLADQFIEIAKTVGRIITSDANGNILVVKKGDGGVGMPYIIGNNLNGRGYIEDGTGMYDKYTVVSQSSRQKGNERKTTIKGSVGSGLREKIIRAKHAMSEKECKTMAEKEMQKDMQKLFTYRVELKSAYGDINVVHPITDSTLGVIEPMLVQAYTWNKSSDSDLYSAVFERLE